MLSPRIGPYVVLGAIFAYGGVQFLFVPVETTAVTVQVVLETAFLLTIIGGLLWIPFAIDVEQLTTEEVDAVFPPLLLGIGGLGGGAITDVLDEFLGYPRILLAVLEDASRITGVILLLVGILRWNRYRARRERILRDQRDQLDRQNHRLEAFANVVSHDLRNPLSTALGYVDMTRETGQLSHLDPVERSLDRMETIITDVLSFARLGDSAVDPQSVSLAAIARAAWETVDTADTELVSLPPDDVHIVADASYLRQLLENLFRNAVEHGAVGAGPQTAGISGTADTPLSVTVGTTPSGFFVADTGPGIDPELGASLFDVGVASSDGGTGFGLAIVRTIADAHGWRVSVSEDTTGGARFEFDIQR